ncbi:EAL and HDOD domain-containing protein [Photobacterium alginatilyticum]|uniref:HDOD domain-containing protein n=1 Tax=Photobacterium alginatilyticum TaxID=1775171 RepID=A0ABW9YK68_9GAMM|nr:HDOD domain-containing protein [Photobacterium alginatilyticum]NBI53661.1 HDOD domain-containing protein [Photobacterium alginatilyticum]
MYSYVARQPIFNRQQRTVGYELLFRDGESNAFPVIEANKATCRLLVENYMAVGDNPATAGQRTFINFPYESLIRLLPMLLPKRKVIIEVLESCAPDEELFVAIKYLYRQGYVIALDDFEMSPPWQRFLPYVHIIKLDLMKIGIEQACEFVNQHRDRKLKFLAEKVETRQDYAAAYEAGFQFFQGYYFSKPEMLKNRQVEPEKLTTVRLLQEICREPVDFNRVEKIISSDVSLSYLLLRYVNAAAHRTIEPISSFKQALVYLGEDKIKMFVSAVATAHAAIDKPRELYSLSLQRARMCEMLAASSRQAVEKDKAFLTGLFSLLDALLDNSLEQLLTLLPLEPDVRDALLNRQGALGRILALLDAYEQADWETVGIHCQALGIREELVAKTYQHALQWSSQYLDTSPNPDSTA